MRSKKHWFFALSDKGKRDQDKFGEVYRGILAVVREFGVTYHYFAIYHLQSGCKLPGWFEDEDNAKRMVEILLDGYEADLLACVNTKTIPPGMAVFYAKRFREIEGVSYTERKPGKETVSGKPKTQTKELGETADENEDDGDAATDAAEPTTPEGQKASKRRTKGSRARRPVVRYQDPFCVRNR